MVAFTGDMSARTLAQVQPVKFASMEALYDGSKNAGLVVFGILKNSDEKILEEKEVRNFVMKIKIPGLLSIMSGGSKDFYVPGIRDLINTGDQNSNILPIPEMIQRGKFAKGVLDDYKRARLIGDRNLADVIRREYFDSKAFFEEYFRYFGYAFLNSPEDAVPNVPVAFYSFHLMVMLGFFFILVCILALMMLFRDTLIKNRWFMWVMLISIPLVYISSEAGWILAEMGRQPWIIQNLMPVSVAVSQISTASVLTTFILFAMLFTALLAADVSIMVKQIKTGPKH
jgi:cytochrome d ubiquinol oxidase subunit I